MCKWKVNLVVSIALVAGPLQSVIAEGPRQPPSAAPRMEKGFVEGQTYKNASLGLELTPDASLRFGAPELRGNSKTGLVSISIMAVGKVRRGFAVEATAFWSVALAYYPTDRRSTDDCLRRKSTQTRKTG
jgi:hypothetical protein